MTAQTDNHWVESLGIRSIGLYTLALLACMIITPVPAILAQVSTEPHWKNWALVLLIFFLGIALGYTWHDKRMREQKRRMIWLQLSSREQQVAELLLKGLSNPEIGEHLFIEVNTVKTHLKNIYRKSACHDRKEFRKLFQS